MDDFICDLQADDFISGDDYLAWVNEQEQRAEQQQRSEHDRHWDNVPDQIDDQFFANQPKPF